jgi:hypothetical protein
MFPFDFSAGRQSITCRRLRQARLNAALDLDKNDYHVRDNDLDLPSLSSAA